MDHSCGACFWSIPGAEHVATCCINTFHHSSPGRYPIVRSLQLKTGRNLRSVRSGSLICVCSCVCASFRLLLGLYLLSMRRRWCHETSNARRPFGTRKNRHIFYLLAQDSQLEFLKVSHRLHEAITPYIAALQDLDPGIFRWMTRCPWIFSVRWRYFRRPHACMFRIWVPYTC